MGPLRIEPAGPGSTLHDLRMKPAAMGTGKDLEHAFYVNRLGTPGIDHPILPHCLHKWFQVVLAVQVKERVGIEVHKNQGYRLSPEAHPPVFQLKFMGCCQHTSYAVNRV